MIISSCEKPPQPQPEPENKPAITIPTQSQAVFNNGISFSTPPSQQGSQPQPQTQTVTFTATESWSATVADTKASSWLTVEPSSGGAGTVNMTVKAEPNDTDKARKATVTIKCGSTTKTFTVEQAAKPADPVDPSEPIAVTSISLNKKELVLSEGDSETLVATVKPDDATDKTVTWSSSDETVATVDKDGKVTAVKEGSATITAIAGEKSATCAVTVSKDVIAVTEITLNKSSLVLKEGGSETLVATVKPDNATDKTVTWSTSDASVATVDEDGKVTAVKEGSATISAKAGEKTASCVVTVSKNVIAVTSVTLNKTELTLTIGKIETLTATVKPDDATDKTVTWTTSDASITTVNTRGEVTAIAEGTATVTAKAGDKTARCVVRVSKRPVTGISINQDAAYLFERESVQLSVWVNVDASEQTATWTSSNPSVAKVDASGLVTAIKAGEAVISARVGEMTATCEVTVYANVSSISLNKTQLTMLEGDGEKLTATLSPDEVSSWLVHWSSSDPSVATVNAAGYVTAIKAGTATITASAGASLETFKSASCIITVTEDVISVELDKTNLVLMEGEENTLVATVEAGNAVGWHVTWTSSNPSVATVDASGRVKAIGAGDAAIWARAGNKEARCFVTVRAAIPVSSVVLNKTSLSLEVGYGAELSVEVYPEDATSGLVSWSSSNPHVATVSAGYGWATVRAVGAGSATISATAGGVTATCSVTAVVSVTRFSLNTYSLDLYLGETETLVATIEPSNATDKSIKWESKDSSVATVDAYGRVTAVGVGTTEITASVNSIHGVYRNVVYVRVGLRPVTGVTLNKTTLALVEGESETLFATVTPDNAADKTVTWSSSNNQVASVDDNGRVTARHEGLAFIYAQSGNEFDACEVHVSPLVPPVVKVSSISLNKTSLDLALGESETLIATVYPDNAADKTVTWWSTNQEVAKVDNQGKVTAYKAGQARIVAHAGQYDAGCDVNVTSEGLGGNPEGFEVEEGEW